MITLTSTTGSGRTLTLDEMDDHDGTAVYLKISGPDQEDARIVVSRIELLAALDAWSA